MNKEEARDFTARYYNTYIEKTVRFNSSGLVARIRAIEPIEGDHGEYDVYCYLDPPHNHDPAFKDHIFSHVSLKTLIDDATIIH